MNRFTDITDFSREELKESLNIMTFLKDSFDPYRTECAGRTILTAFYEENRDAENAFRAAAVRMGGSAFGFQAQPGESLKDAVKTMSASGDVIVLSHPKRGAALAASLYATVPVINAGDGNRAYPVKTLADFSAVWLTKKHISNLRIGFLGDFSDNPLVKGLLQCLCLYNGNEFVFVSVNAKPLPESYVAIMERSDRPYAVYDNLFDAMPGLDVLYLTRVSEKSFDSAMLYEARKANFVLNERLLLTAKPDLAVLHDFPRGEELPMEVDADSRAKYFTQMEYEINAAMTALLKVIHGRTGVHIKPCTEPQSEGPLCGRADCITSTEPYLPPLYYDLPDGTGRICRYCGAVHE